MNRSTITRLVILLAAVLAACSPKLGRIDPDLFPDPPENAITFWGHACCYIDIGGVGLVTDPVFEMWAAVRRRKVHIPPPSCYRDTQVILLSHAHSDHLSRATLATFPKEAIILCPRPCLDQLTGLEMDVRVMKPGDEQAIPGGRVVAVTADHPGGRYDFMGNDEAGAIGFIIETDRITIYYSGDTNYFMDLAGIGLKYRPDIALLNINAHLHSIDAVRAAWAVRAQTVVPVHFGAFGYLILPEYQKPRNFLEMKKLLEPMFKPLELGESLGF